MLKVDVEPGEVGLDAGRLRRLDDALRPYVDDGRLPGWTAVVTRRGRVVHMSHYGVSDLDSSRPVADDTIWRIYSMTKPVTSVAAMMLYEQGGFELTDPVSRFIPEFADARVYVAGPANAPGTRPVAGPVRVWHLLTHTAGLTYGWLHANAVDEIYRDRGYEFGVPEGVDLAGACAAWAQFPLLFDPGTEWNYSVATDVLGRVVEVASGLPLDRYFAERIFQPLGMTDTAFSVPGDDLHRLAGLYGLGRDGALTRSIRLGEAVTKPVTCFFGGGGLVSTAADYHRFTQMLLRGGELDGLRLLSPRTVAYMTRNHLPGGADLATIGRPVSAESAFEGLGFGFGFSILLDPAAAKVVSSVGEYAWSGLGRTEFYIDPVEEITTMFFTQLLPGPVYPLRGHLRGIVRAAVVD